jgi:ATP-dependent helicase HepA
MNESEIDVKQKVQILFSAVMGEAAKHLAQYLDSILPNLSDNWWKECVLEKLSPEQCRRFQTNEDHVLTSFDMAALLRVLDQNWYLLKVKENYPVEAKHYLKEMQTIRNRWAHVTTNGFAFDDLYRDLDTLQRFGKLINAGEKFDYETRELKSLLISPDQGSEQNPDDTNEDIINEDEIGSMFSPGQIVCLKSNPDVRGAVVSVIAADPEQRYSVFINDDTQMFYESQLTTVQEEESDFTIVSSKMFHAYVTAMQLQHPGLSSLYSLNAARIDYIPYQFRPVLKFIRSDRPRLLIADSVGVGKTIEAGLILRELQARRDIQSILIICPRPLVAERKWEFEMKRFDERFIPVNGKTLRYCINETDLEGKWPQEYRKTIIPYSLFDEVLLYGTAPGGRKKYRKGLLDLDPVPRFDLVIVDEAHHIRNTDTFCHKAVRYICDNAEAVLFLTATPVQLGSQDLFVLLNVLRPDLIIDKASFDHMAEPNPFINQALSFARAGGEGWEEEIVKSLSKAAETPWGRSLFSHNLHFKRTLSQLSNSPIDAQARIKLINDIESLHTFSGIINRTRRCDIGDFTIRKPETIEVPFTPSQQNLHDAILQIQAEIYQQLHGDKNVMFFMSTIRRQAASCLPGLQPMLHEILTRHGEAIGWDESLDEEVALHNPSQPLLEQRIQDILELGKKLDPHDPKYDELKNIIDQMQQQDNNKVMLFSTFRHTLYYLNKKLIDDGFRVGLVHGGIPDDERIRLRNRFERTREDSDALDILLFSEIGCEGLDYQFCACIVNYDLPWNPMRVEQRIGRIDRNGQKSETVAIFNMITPGTVDADIYERCLLRIGVFNHALGDCEEILGEIHKDVRNIASQFELSVNERREKLEQIADNKIRLIEEQEKLEQQQLELFGIRLPADQLQDEIDKASSSWLSSSAMQNLVNLYLQKKCGLDQEYILGKKHLKTLRLSQEDRNSLLHDYQQLPQRKASLYREWELWLKGGEQHLSITFEAGCATKHRDSTFIMPVHPLVLQAATSFDISRRVFTYLEVTDDQISEKIIPFAIYEWRYFGIREDLKIMPVAALEIDSDHLTSLLERAEEQINQTNDIPDTEVWDSLDKHHHTLWSKTREQHKQETMELAQYRRESLEVSHKARITLLNEQLEQAEHEKLRRMRQSQLASAESDFARRSQELAIAIERADVTAQPMAFGILRIVKG